VEKANRGGDDDIDPISLLHEPDPISLEEAEYIACSDATREALWLRRLLGEIERSVDRMMLEHSVNRTVPIITKRRDRLCADTVRYITCLNDWGPSEVPKWMDDVEEIADEKVDGVGGSPGRDGRWRRGRHGRRERRHGRRNQQSGVQRWRGIHRAV
jgi:hypothetical protein